MNRILLIISGSVAAYKSLELIRRLRERGVTMNCILTRGVAEFITPLSVASLSGTPVYSELFSLKDETEMGHIRLSREADLVLVAPASADILAKMAAGLADDLATTALLATDKPVLVAPAMNAKMWAHPATRRNLAQLEQDGITIIPTEAGELACGEVGEGRMAPPETILQFALGHLSQSRPLAGKKALVTSGPTYEAIDPVRFLGNRSSGKQGHAIAEALARAGADVTLISGPVALPDPSGVTTIHVESAQEMLNACEKALPAEIAVFAAAVADWRPRQALAHKLKKRTNQSGPEIEFVENPDILANIAHSKKRPDLVIGFAAETDHLLSEGKAKLQRKGCDWILANNVAGGAVFGEDSNHILFLNEEGSEAWPRMSKQEVARKLVEKVATHFTPVTPANAGASLSHAARRPRHKAGVTRAPRLRSKGTTS